jgi:mRNA-degrading endonuclease toxin of MazEF toxin-antitoxin module
VTVTPGDVFWLDVGPVKGNEITHRRPFIVVQAAMNLSTVICVPTSTSRAATPFRVEVELEGVATLACAEHARALSIEERLKEQHYIGNVGPVVLAEIRNAFLSLLGI